MKAELPGSIRKLFTVRRFRKMLESRRRSLTSGICAQLMRELNPPTEPVETTVKTIAESIENQLEHMMARAALLIH